jgi:hypothetical protein
MSPASYKRRRVRQYWFNMAVLSTESSFIVFPVINCFAIERLEEYVMNQEWIFTYFLL